MKQIRLDSLILFFISSLYLNIYAQQFLITGKVEDKNTQQPLSYANIRVINSTNGTATNKEGIYELRLKAGKYLLIASYIGYNTDTLSISVIENLNNVDFLLSPTNIQLPEVVVKPGVNPAIAIIKNAILKKDDRNRRIHNYEYEAYTKGIIRSQSDIRAGKNDVSMGLGENDSIPLKITGILESKSRGYFEKPNDYKEIILARKQSSNFPPSINTLTGGRLIQNLYEDKIDFLGNSIPGPLADNALDYYYFYIKKTVAIDKRIVYQLNMSPDNPSDPGFAGDIFITSDTYDMIKVDLQLNRAANVGGIFDSIQVFQQFSSYDSIYMPVDYRIFVKANLLGLLKFGFELNSILYDYKINTQMSDSIFNKAVVTVLPDADKKNLLYWNNTQTIPHTSEEESAYKRIDSISSVPLTFWDRFSPLSTRISLNDNFSISAPLGMYHFNRIEGHAIDFGFFGVDLLDKRVNSHLNLSYGFSDNKFQSDFNFRYLLGDYRTYSLNFNLYKNLNVLFGSSDEYSDLIGTFLPLFLKEDFRDYYYSNGFDIKLGGEVFPVLSFNLGFINHTDKNAIKNTDFSFFNRNKKFDENPSIYETKINAVTGGFRFDFRDYIEDGFFRRRISPRTYFIFEGDITYSKNSFLRSSLDYTKYDISLSGRISTFNSANLNFRIYGMYNKGKLPFQLLYAFPGNVDALSQNYSFRTLKMNEILGDRVITVFLENYFGSELFRFLRIPGLKDWEFLLNTFLNFGISDVSERSRSILVREVKGFPHPFYELGFGIGHVLVPFRLEFAWKLNYREENNFRIGLNSFIF